MLFDIDGTLFDSDPVHFEVFQELLAKEGINEVSECISILHERVGRGCEVRRLETHFAVHFGMSRAQSFVDTDAQQLGLSAQLAGAPLYALALSIITVAHFCAAH